MRAIVAAPWLGALAATNAIRPCHVPLAAALTARRPSKSVSIVSLERSHEQAKREAQQCYCFKYVTLSAARRALNRWCTLAFHYHTPFGISLAVGLFASGSNHRISNAVSLVGDSGIWHCRNPL